MKTKHFIMSLLFISFGLLACSEDEDERFFLYEAGGELCFPEQPISDTTTEIISSSYVGMTGGVAPYTMKTGDENIAKARYFEKRDCIIISPIKLGTTYLVVKDANGLTAKIGVKVVKGRQSFWTDQVSVKTEGVSDGEKVALEKKVIEESDMYATGSMQFVYDTETKGTLTMMESDDATETITAPFAKITKKVDGKYTFVYGVSYNGVEHEFYLVLPERPLAKDGTTRVIGLGRDLRLVEDVTQIYQKTYPKVTSVKRIYDGQLSR